MKDFNKVMLLGRLGADPILRRTKTGIPVAHFTLATGTFRNPSRQNEKSASPKADPGKPEQSAENQGVDSTQTLALPDESTPVIETEWHKIVVWGKVAENCHSLLHKGSPVFVEGSIRSHHYLDKNGNQKTAFEIYAENLSYFTAKRSENKESLPIGVEAAAS